MFDTKIAVVIRDDLATWQKLNVTAFLTSGIVGANAGLLGELYIDSAGHRYHAPIVQPLIVLSAGRDLIKTIYSRAMQSDVGLSIHIEEMFATGNDAANRAAVHQYGPEQLKRVGLALREDRSWWTASSKVRACTRSPCLNRSSTHIILARTKQCRPAR